MRQHELETVGEKTSNSIGTVIIAITSPNPAGPVVSANLITAMKIRMCNSRTPEQMSICILCNSIEVILIMPVILFTG
ncbi:MAG: hypothetical protein JW852_06745 [Spirochaetales bacterium]|nr:hypothetical protein [Spirochaetales bacterium]